MPPRVYPCFNPPGAFCPEPGPRSKSSGWTPRCGGPALAWEGVWVPRNGWSKCVLKMGCPIGKWNRGLLAGGLMLTHSQMTDPHAGDRRQHVESMVHGVREVERKEASNCSPVWLRHMPGALHTQSQTKMNTV